MKSRLLPAHYKKDAIRGLPPRSRLKVHRPGLHHHLQRCLALCWSKATGVLWFLRGEVWSSRLLVLNPLPALSTLEVKSWSREEPAKGMVFSVLYLMNNNISSKRKAPYCHSTAKRQTVAQHNTSHEISLSGKVYKKVLANQWLLHKSWNKKGDFCPILLQMKCTNDSTNT